MFLGSLDVVRKSVMVLHTVAPFPTFPSLPPVKEASRVTVVDMRAPWEVAFEVLECLKCQLDTTHRVLLQFAHFGPGSLRSQSGSVISVSVHMEEAPGRVPDVAEGVVVKGGGGSVARCRHE